MNNENLLQKEAKMMKLEKLIAQRESVSTKPFPVPVKELLKRYEQLYTGAISDVLREFCLLDQSLPGHLRPLRDSAPHINTMTVAATRQPLTTRRVFCRPSIGMNTKPASSEPLTAPMVFTA